MCIADILKTRSVSNKGPILSERWGYMIISCILYRHFTFFSDKGPLLEMLR